MDFNIEEYKAILRVMTAKFDAYCKENGLRYSLCAGSLLGAVRHHGIIPWDDDVDVMMPRPDYNRLLELSKDSFVEGYKIVHAGNAPHYYLPLAKMTDTNTCLIEMKHYMECPIGVNIDIFPVDVIPEDESERESVYRKFIRLYALATQSADYAHYKSPFTENGFRLNNLLHWIKNKIYRCVFNSAKVFAKADALTSQIDWASGRHCRIYTSYQYHNRIFEKDLFDHYTELDFDGMKIMSIAGYETYLKTLFKDYMKLPPKEKQVCHHHHYFLDMNRGYSIDELKKMGIIKY